MSIPPAIRSPRIGTGWFDYGNSTLAFGDGQLADNTPYFFVIRRDPTMLVFGGGVNAAAISCWDGTSWHEMQGGSSYG